MDIPLALSVRPTQTSRILLVRAYVEASSKLYFLPSLQCHELFFTKSTHAHSLQHVFFWTSQSFPFLIYHSSPLLTHATKFYLAFLAMGGARFGGGEGVLAFYTPHPLAHSPRIPEGQASHFHGSDCQWPIDVLCSTEGVPARFSLPYRSQTPHGGTVSPKPSQSLSFHIPMTRKSPRYIFNFPIPLMNIDVSSSHKGQLPESSLD